MTERDKLNRVRFQEAYMMNKARVIAQEIGPEMDDLLDMSLPLDAILEQV